ncbi:hypothetical protein BK133_08435 [Paenibacillus sp. FSL H8-0548]|uniref:hypothetical protein n=1 Tax=Paenibacillus sp. FSL H8-0548 TaxID=1920422 RepID=UPI00096D9E39|nr:hypothetical protein [Paenibacillus sp. FSL H8-0548]OMF36930.1 hypothetical protein BK133_08435 [Paenibacillus sp. FSL H8-0548]
MMKKLPVIISPYIKTRYPYNKLKICRRCNHFTVLGDEDCPVCGKSSLLGVEQRAASILKRSMWGARVIVMLIWAISLVVSQSILQTSLSIIGGAVLLALLWTLQRRLTPALLRVELENLFHKEAYTLVAGLANDREEAIKVFHSGNKPLAYEMLREIGALVHTDQLRIEQILLLQSFMLRKDMDLMIDPLLMDHFNTDLVEYIGELAKIRRDLLKENTFRYVLLHEIQILKMEQGDNILASVAGAAVRMQRYISLYPYLIMRYAGKLPKDRFLRLYRMLQSNPEIGTGPLYEEVMRVYNEKYKWDEDFRSTGNETELK